MTYDLRETSDLPDRQLAWPRVPLRARAVRVPHPYLAWMSMCPRAHGPVGCRAVDRVAAGVVVLTDGPAGGPLLGWPWAALPGEGWACLLPATLAPLAPLAALAALAALARLLRACGDLGLAWAWREPLRAWSGPDYTPGKDL